MARKRMIDPNMWQSEDSSKMSTFARFVFVGMFSIADDSGRGRANATYIKSTLFPYDDMPTADVDAALSEIAQHMSITFYKTANGNEYYSLNNWDKWQKIDRPVDSLFPECDDSCEIIRGSSVVKSLVEDSTRTRRATTANRIEENIKEDKINKDKDIYSDVVSLLNENAGTNYRHNSSKTRKLISARIKDGFTVSDFRQVILNKCSDWNHEPRSGDIDMRQYLRPDTLFGTKFEAYLNQCSADIPKYSHDPSETLPPPAWLSKENPTLEEILGMTDGE